MQSLSDVPPQMPEQRATAAAYVSLRGLILDGGLMPGSILQDRKLADDLGVSRTPIREALQRLEGEGLVERRGRILLVASISIREVCEIFGVRQLLEAEAAKCACDRISPASIASIRAVVAQLSSPSSISDDDHWQADDLVHLSIARESGNALLLKLIGELRQRTRLFGLNRIPSRFGAGRTEHLAILDALAAELMRAHLANARQAVVIALTGGRA